MAQSDTPVPASVTEDARKAARARVRTHTVHSVLLKRAVSYNLLLPRDYEKSGLRYPVLYLLHGTGDDHTSWNTRSGIALYAADLPLIIVMPDAGLTRYINTPGGGRYQDFFLQEFVPHIDRTYRTISRREGRAMAGLSMGGFGTLRLGMAAPERFASLAALSGSFAWGEVAFEEPLYRDRAVALYGGSGPKQQALWTSDRVWPHVEKNIGADGKWKGPALYFVIGTGDHLLPSNRLLRQRLEEKRIPFTYTEDYGVHDWAFWDHYIQDALAFTLRYVAVPELSAAPR